MATLAELAREQTDLDDGGLAHLQRLVASWALLADFSFADLLLFVPVRHPDGPQFVVAAQIRPTTSQTLYKADLVGRTFDETERQLVARAYRLGEIIEGEAAHPPVWERVRVLAIPVRWHDETIAVLTRESTPTFGRQPGELERIYVDVFNRFARMIAAGQFPYVEVDSESDDAPRVGDGVIVLDADLRVTYNSPNAVSALHRVGVHANAEGVRLGDLGLDDEWVRTAYSIPAPVTEEIERGPEITVLFRCVPLLDNGRPSGAVLLVRDISDVRRRDRLLLSKDATIREIHHRVKNNLQTISSLLRLQGRRLASPEAKAAIEESVRRVRSIALVHETLSREAGEDVPFVDIVKPLVRIVEEGLYSAERPVRVHVEGDGGKLAATIATPLAVVLTELIQNAFDHAYPDASALGGGRVAVVLDNDGRELTIRVVDDGVGIPPEFAIERSSGLGLSIVRTLVTSELHGSITMERGNGAMGRPGTVVTLVVPVGVTRAA
jgi:two-component system, sensor histidine kinase PdtaS